RPGHGGDDGRTAKVPGKKTRHHPRTDPRGPPRGAFERLAGGGYSPTRGRRTGPRQRASPLQGEALMEPIIDIRGLTKRFRGKSAGSRPASMAATSRSAIRT